MSKTTPKRRNGKSAGGRKKTPAYTQTVTFDDNRLLPALFGEHDQHLALIEDMLEIEANPRGNHVVLAGAKDACAVAELALLALYQGIGKGRVLDVGEVRGAVRMAMRPIAAGGESDAEAIRGIDTRKRLITARSANQQRYMAVLGRKTLVFGTGPAGTGKTYLAVAAAVRALIEGTVERIILSRPAVEAGERLGFLPGDLRDKIDPYLRPFYDALYDLMPDNQVARSLEDGSIEIAPLAFMRGRTLSNAFIILDEAQNCTSMQMRMFLTRLGDKSFMTVTGDLSQTDLPPEVDHGLEEAVVMLAGLKDVGHVEFEAEDVMRSSIVTDIIRAYDKRDAQKRRSRKKAAGTRRGKDKDRP